MKKGPQGCSTCPFDEWLCQGMRQRQPPLPRESAGQKLTICLPTCLELAPPTQASHVTWAPGKVCQPEPIHHRAFVQNQSPIALHWHLPRSIPRLSGIISQSGQTPGGGRVSLAQLWCHSDEPRKMRPNCQVFRRVLPPLPLPPSFLSHYTRTHFRRTGCWRRQPRSAILLTTQDALGSSGATASSPIIISSEVVNEFQRGQQ